VEFCAVGTPGTEIPWNFAPLGLREQKFHRILRRWDSVGRNSARSVAHFTIYNSKGRQSLGESPSPSDCVGVSRQKILLADGNPNENIINYRR
jgi:hypothetical protein